MKSPMDMKVVSGIEGVKVMRMREKEGEFGGEGRGGGEGLFNADCAEFIKMGIAQIYSFKFVT